MNAEKQRLQHRHGGSRRGSVVFVVVLAEVPVNTQEKHTSIRPRRADIDRLRARPRHVRLCVTEGHVFIDIPTVCVRLPLNI